MKLTMSGARALAACLAFALAGVSMRSATDPLAKAAPEAVGLSSARLGDATRLLEQYVADRKIAGAVAAVARKGRLVYLQPVGLQDIATRTAMSERSMFRIYSMTKSFTSVAAMMLFEEGRFQLSDPVSKYIPEFASVMVRANGGARPPARPVTVEDLLLHTSGLNHRTSAIYQQEKVRSRSMSLPQFVSNAVRVGLMEDPGTRYRYSEGTTVVGRLVEIWSGMPLDVFFTERIFKPLRLEDTGFWVEPSRRPLLATVYAPAQGGGLTPVELEEVPFTERPQLLEGAVGLVSTVPDFLRFSQMLLNKGELDGVRILKASTVEMMTANRLPEAVLRARGGSMGWGLANVNVLMTPPAGANAPNRGEYGWDGTAGTIFWIDPATEMVTILMTQSSPANPDNVRGRFKAIVQQATMN
jgi:CubicO group peptidase (beta-lactamase class C family)